MRRREIPARMKLRTLLRKKTLTLLLRRELTKKEDKKESKTVKKTVTKEKKKLHRRTLTVSRYHIGTVQPYSNSVMAESKSKLETLAQKDKERMMLEEARNKLESYIYLIKNKLVDDEEAIAKVSTEEQREVISKAADEAEDWMYDDGYNADLATMTAKYEALSAPAEKIFFRVSESTARPEAVAALKKKLGKVVALMTKWETTKPQVTEEERKEVLEKVESVTAWIAEKEAEQEAADPAADPVFTSEDVPLRLNPIEKLVGKLNKKPKPVPKKEEKKANETESASTEKESETTTTEEASEEAADSEKEPATEESDTKKAEETDDEL
jgi:hypoxia up-regulated 1